MIVRHLKDLEGTDAVLWFWAPWCTVCRAEAPDVAETAEAYEDEDMALVGVAGGGLVVLALLVRVCGRSVIDAGALWSGGARVPRLVVGPRPVLSECSWASETPPDAEKPVHTREPMVSRVRVEQPEATKCLLDADILRAHGTPTRVWVLCAAEETPHDEP